MGLRLGRKQCFSALFVALCFVYWIHKPTTKRQVRQDQDRHDILMLDYTQFEITQGLTHLTMHIL
jgi:hypothetical protein